MAERRQVPGCQLGHECGQLVEPGHTGDHCVVGRVAKKVKGECQPIGGGATATPHRRDGPDLAGPDSEAPGMKGASEREPDLGVAVPGEVEDCALRGQQVQPKLESGGGGAGVYDEVAAVCGIGRKREVCTQPGHCLLYTSPSPRDGLLSRM